MDRSAPLELDGVSLVPVLADPSRPVHDVNFAEWFVPNGGPPHISHSQAIRDDRFKLVVDRITGVESFYEYVGGALDEGPDLLPCGLTAEQEAGRAALRARLDELAAGMEYDNPPWTEPAPDTGGAGGTGETGGTGDTGPADSGGSADTGGPPACSLVVPGGSGAP